jgi:hypothetical protein
MGVCLQTVPVLAQDQDQKKQDTKDAASAPHAASEKPKAAKQVKQKPQQRNMSANDKPQGKSKTDNLARDNRSTVATMQNTGVVKQSGRQTQQRQSRTTATAVQGNRSNQYNNQWVAGNTHRDWDRNSNHRWNNHDYRWYDGGWLIIDVGASPDYYQTGSLVIRVKQSLADQGYYNGHFSATVGPRTRSAISHYESDKGLQVNGQIDGPLLASLGLE